MTSKQMIDELEEAWCENHPDEESLYTLVSYVYDPPRGYTLRAIVEFSVKLNSAALELKLTSKRLRNGTAKQSSARNRKMKILGRFIENIKRNKSH